MSPPEPPEGSSSYTTPPRGQETKQEKKGNQETLERPSSLSLIVEPAAPCPLAASPGSRPDGQDCPSVGVFQHVRRRDVPGGYCRNDTHPTGYLAQPHRMGKLGGGQQDESGQKQREHYTQCRVDAPRSYPHVEGEDGPGRKRPGQRKRHLLLGYPQLPCKYLQNPQGDPERPIGTKASRCEGVLVPKLPHPGYKLSEPPVDERQRNEVVYRFFT